MLKRLGLLALLLILPVLAHAAPKAGGRVGPDGKTELTCDLPRDQRRKNVGGRDGAGLCVFTSIEFAAKWCGERALWGFQDQMRKEPGGGYPEKVDAMIKKYAPGVPYVQDTTGDPAVLEAVLKSGRMACVTYDGHDDHYGNQSIAHMVCLVCFDGRWAVVSDNNFIEEDQFEWMTPAEFTSRWKGNSGGWVVCLLKPPPPPPPHN
jgi:hypothetical protein